MNLAQIWDIVWQNEPFHWATVIVLLVAIIVELYTLWQYWYSECGETADAIQSLRNPNKSQKHDNFKLQQWKEEHLKIKNGKFILINYPVVLARPIPRSSLRFVTTLCTAIGVLGTFYGIQQGLQGINLDTTSSQQLMNSSKELLVGMKTAFSTSLMGLGSGSLFTIILFICDSLRQKRRDDLRQKLKAIATLETADNANSEIAQVLNLVADKLTEINLSAEAIGEAVGKEMQSVIVPPLRGIFEEQQKLRELQENQGQRVLEELIKDLRIEVLQPIAARLDKSAELTQQASEAVLTLHKDLASSIVTIQNFQKETLVSLEDFALHLKQTLSQFETDTKGVLEQTAHDINRAIDQSIQGMTVQQSAFEASAENAADTFRGIREELETALQKRAEVEKHMFQATRTGIIHILAQANTAFEQQTNTLETVGNQACKLMNRSQENLIATLGNIDHTLTATRQTVQDDLTQFREQYQANLQAFFIEQNNLLEGTLGKQRDGLAAVVTNLDTVFQDEAKRRSELTQEVDQSMNKIQATVQQINKEDSYN
ncbi:hypothetical protein OGM63_03360 [Plectonema radiosum NIES-515]|uniref:MotA/TolQ/ExbB proton channel domain-containing protein n=1 Tax=Plectonema radiosum NIES-515 TaxID=2986073 RepID=A0ABT3ATX7_9CYAN|nr:hypothetical protein [Plectonema radiosum]MCV3212577.1 hypothetical protein [Plectonema radiosum NIES-515]